MADRQPELDEAELARRSVTSVERIRLLVDIGVLAPGPDGSFEPADVQRIAIVDAYERCGIALEHLARAIRDQRMSFEFTDRIYPPASAPTSRTVADLAAELGERAEILPELFLALGLPSPDPDHRLTEADAAMLPRLIDAWSAPGIEPDALLRAARLLGDAARRTTEGWVALFLESVGLSPEATARMTIDELRGRLFEPAVPIAQSLEPAMVWLLRRHMQQALNAVNVESMEEALDAAGVRPLASREPAAIVFADMSGFTRITDELGDQVAVGHAERLGRIASASAARLGGRVVKQLGDGVMLAFERVAPAVDAAVALRANAAAAGLPELHVGVSAGPVVQRDGDYFGRTVNLAARLSGAAGPGEIVANEVVASTAGERRFVALGMLELKGFLRPIAAYRLESPEPS
jgi:class 3 adenylate cyclase